MQKSNKWLVGTVIVAGFITLGVAEAFIGPALSYFADKWRVSLADSGLTFTMLFGGACVAAVASSRLLRWLGLARLLAVDMLLLAGGVALFALAPNLWLVMPITLLLGLGTGGLAMMLNYAASTIYARRAAVALNLLNGCFGIGALAGPLLVRFALSGGVPLEVLLLGFSAVAALLGFAYLALPLATATTVEEVAAPSIRLLLHNRYVLTLSMIFFLYVGVEVGFGGWAATIATQGAHLDAATATLVATAFWLAFTLGRMLAALVSTWLPASGLLIGAAGLGVVGAVLAAVSDGPLLTFTGAIVVGLGCAPIFPVAFALATGYRAAWAASVTGLAMLGGSLGGAVLPYVQGQLLTFGTLVGAGFISVVLLLVIALQLSLPRRDAKPLAPRNTGTQAAVEC